MSRFKIEEKRITLASTGREKAVAAVLLIVLLAFLADSVYLISQGGFFDVVNFSKDPYFSIWRVLKFIVLVIACGGAAVVHFGDRGLEKKSTRIMTWLAYAVTPVVAHFFMEFANPSGTPKMWRLHNWIEPGCRRDMLKWMVASIVIMYLLLLAFYAVTSNIRVASIMLCVLSGVFGLANYYVTEFRGVCLFASDLSTIQTAANVAEGYSYQLNYPTIFMLLGLVYWCVILCKMPKKASKHGLKYRVAVLLFGALICGGSGYGLMYTDFMTSGYLHLKINNFAPVKSYKAQGQVLTFLRSAKLLIKDKPENYSADLAAEIAQPYLDKYAAECKSGNFNQPNVICIMNEALTDYSALGDFKTSEDVLEYYHGLKENTVKGLLNVSVFGGKTANTEFEFLTGMTNGFMPKSTTPYQLFIKEDIPSLARNLKNDGYQGIKAFHPFKETGYNRNNVYPFMGFDDFISIEDLTVTDDMIMRKQVSDKADYDIVIDEFNQAKKESDAPFFMFNVTMQNHSPYEDDFPTLPSDVEIVGPCAGERANRYVNLINASDDAIKYIVEYFKKVDEPTVIVIFGDHEAEFTEKFYGKLLGKDVESFGPEENMIMYKTAYMIWANFDIDEKTNYEVSSNYLATLMKETAGMKMSPYELFLEDIRKEIPVITENGYFGADGKYYDIKDTESPYYKYIYKYNVLEYNNMFDKGHRLADFYE